VEFHLTAMGRHLPYGITQCYLLPDTSERCNRFTILSCSFLLHGLLQWWKQQHVPVVK